METKNQISDKEKLKILTQLLDKANISLCNVISTLVVYGKKAAQGQAPELNTQELIDLLQNPLDAVTALQRIYLASAESMVVDQTIADNKDVAEVVEKLKATLAAVPETRTMTHDWTYDRFCGENGLVQRVAKHLKEEAVTSVMKVGETIDIRDVQLNYAETENGLYGVGTTAETLVLFDDERKYAIFYTLGSEDPTMYLGMAGQAPISMRTMSASAIGSFGVIIDRILNRYI